MSSELAVVPDFTAVAVNAMEMRAANERINNWLLSKVDSLQTIILELEASIESAKKNKWSSKSLKAALKREQSRHLYYTKMISALHAGYTIVPNMDVDVIAIRTNRKKPIVHSMDKSSSYANPSVPMLPNESEQHLEIGAGEYKSSAQLVEVERESLKQENGATKHTVMVTPTDFDEIDFPLAVANSVVMDATAEAMSLKLFDRIGVVVSQTERHGDPIVLGQIIRTENGSRKVASFLIAWYLDVRTL